MILKVYVGSCVFNQAFSNELCSYYMKCPRREFWKEGTQFITEYHIFWKRWTINFQDLDLFFNYLNNQKKDRGLPYKGNTRETKVSSRAGPSLKSVLCGKNEYEVYEGMSKYRDNRTHKMVCHPQGKLSLIPPDKTQLEYLLLLVIKATQIV